MTSDAASREPGLGNRIRALRAARSWTLEQASQASGLARSTLSKIENGQMSPTYDALIKLAAGFGLSLSQLFSDPSPMQGVARRSVSLHGVGVLHATPCYAHTLLCHDFSNKSMVPFRTRITARAFEDFEDWSRHAGEEFVYVLQGTVRLFSEFYEPVELSAGDSWYIDSRMGHRVISISEEDAQVLWVSTTNPQHL